MTKAAQRAAIAAAMPNIDGTHVAYAVDGEGRTVGGPVLATLAVTADGIGIDGRLSESINIHGPAGFVGLRIYDRTGALIIETDQPAYVPTDGSVTLSWP